MVKHQDPMIIKRLLQLLPYFIYLPRFKATRVIENIKVRPRRDKHDCFTSQVFKFVQVNSCHRSLFLRFHFFSKKQLDSANSLSRTFK